MSHAVPTAIFVFLWGVASFAIMSPLQLRVMTAAARAPNLASAVNIVAFNPGNAIGAALGGIVIAKGFGYPAVALAGAATAATGFVAVVAARRLARLPRSPSAPRATVWIQPECQTAMKR